MLPPRGPRGCLTIATSLDQWRLRARTTLPLLLQSLQQFLEHGDEVLRFYLLWEIPAEQGGGRARFKLHYFVADSTVGCWVGAFALGIALASSCKAPGHLLSFLRPPALAFVT